MKRSRSSRLPRVLLLLLAAAAVAALIVSEPYLKDLLLSSAPHVTVYETGPVDPESALTVHIIDVGQGDAALVTFPDGETMLIDAGSNASETALLSYLDRRSVKTIDLAVFTHMHEDHIGGADRIFSACRVRQTLISPVTDAETSSCTRLKTAAEAEGCAILTAEPGQTFRIGGADILILAPDPMFRENTNNASIVLLLTYGERAFLFTGDAEAESEERILSQFPAEQLRADFIKLGHHGSSSSTSEALLDAVRPVLASAGCGAGNEFGHPHREVLRRLEERKILLLRTDLCGSVRISTDGKHLSVDTDRPLP